MTTSKDSPCNTDAKAAFAGPPGSAIDAAIRLANTSNVWFEQDKAMRAFDIACPPDGARIVHHRALKVLADEVVRLRSVSPNTKGQP